MAIKETVEKIAHMILFLSDTDYYCFFKGIFLNLVCALVLSQEKCFH